MAFTVRAAQIETRKGRAVPRQRLHRHPVRAALQLLAVRRRKLEDEPVVAGDLAVDVGRGVRGEDAVDFRTRGERRPAVASIAGPA